MEYPKIETLLDRDERFRVTGGKWRLPEFEYLQNNHWLFTEKVDGTNVRVIWDGASVEIRGRTDNAQMPPFLIKRVNELITPEKLVAIWPKSDEPVVVILFGEGYGAKIQKGGGNYKSDGVDFVLFDVLVGRWWLKWTDVLDVGY